MSKISVVKAFTNGEIAYISWTINEMIPNCLGFEITRIYPDNPEDNTILPAWVAFKGQSNKDWIPQNTSVWPVQKLSWKDLTLRKKRDQIVRRNDGTRIQYLVRPIVAYKNDLEEVKTDLAATYGGSKVKLSYFDAGKKSDIITITLDHGPIRATFTNGILATQWLAHAMGDPDYDGIKKEIKNKDSSIRKYLAGDVLETLKALLDRAAANPAATLKMALYELEDEELMDAIKANKDKIDIILSNTGADKHGSWDGENSDNRKWLHDEHAKIADRMFNNKNSIGHNKFVIYLEHGNPLCVMTGSTNWTSSGLCAQSNNAVLIESPEVASLYDDYFELLRIDNAAFVVPNPLSAITKNVQGDAIRKINAKGNDTITLSDGTRLTIWFSPNTPNVSVNKKKMPPDLSNVYSIMRKAEKAIFFAVFLPGRSNNRQGDIMTNVITEAITLAEKDTSLMVYGAVSDPSAMPTYINPVKGVDTPTTPYTYDLGKLHLIRAASLNGTKDDKDLIGDFQKELLKTPGGHAIIHDKIVVIDPFSDHGTVIFGSHNQGFKASYGNDENLLIIQNNPGLVKAFALHVLDIFEHYRFRAVQAQLQLDGKKKWEGFLSKDDKWLKKALASGGKADLANYINGIQ